jgi:hypothetical protein
MAGTAPGLPRQYGHKSNSLLDRGRQEATPELTASCAKTVFCLAREVALLARDHPVDRIGFLTLTFAENLVDRKEAWRRFRSLRSRVLSTRFVCCIAVSERQWRGALHFHLIVVTKSFLGTASDAGWAKQAQTWWQCGHRKEAMRMRSAHVCQSLRDEWAFWRKIAPRYGFGRCEILPVMSDAEAVGKYCGKYVESNIRNRIPTDKGVRRVSYINFKGRRTHRPNFAWNSPGARAWRQEVAKFAWANRCRDTDDLRAKFGRRWCYKFRGLLLGLTQRKIESKPLHTRGVGETRSQNLRT